MALVDDLIAYWTLDEASGTRADSHGSNTLTDNGSVPGAAGKINNGADFEKTGAPGHRLTRSDGPSTSTGDIDFTWSCWVNAETLVDFPPIISKWFTGASSHREYQLRYNDSLNRFQFQVTSDGTLGTVTTVEWSSASSTSTWYFLVAWHDATNNQIGIMVDNGTAVTVSHAGGVFDGDSDFEVGGTLTQDLYWDGLIDEIGFWKRLLTTEEKTALWNGGAGLPYSSFAGDATPFFSTIGFKHI